MVRHVSEIAYSNERVLIVEKKPSLLFKLLKNRLEQYDIVIQKTTELPQSFTRFNRIYFLNVKPGAEITIPSTIKTTVILSNFLNKKTLVPASQKHIKYIILSPETITEDHLTQILWFSASASNEQILDLRKGLSTTVGINPNPYFLSKMPRRQTVIGSLIALLLFVCLSFIAPLVPATMIHISMLDSFTKDSYVPVSLLQPISSFLTRTSTVLFVPARPFYSMFSASQLPESYLRFNSYTENYFNTAKVLTQTEQKLLQSLSSQQETSTSTISRLLDSTGMLNEQVADYIERVGINLPNFSELDSIKKGLKNKLLISEKIKKALPIVSAFATDTKDKTIMVLIINNSRIRGSGGVIDSVGIIDFVNGKVTSSEFYSAKQLTSKKINLENIVPILVNHTPAELTMLNDATTSVDLYDAQSKLINYLSPVFKKSKPNVTLLITTSAMQNILEVFPALQFNGNREIVTSENISIKQQLYGSNPAFFPTVVNRMNENLGTVNPNKLFSAIITSFNEKQLAVLTGRKDIQQMLDGLYWSGKTIAPKCVSSTLKCINDYLFSVDQDLSSRSGPSYVQKSVTKMVRFPNTSTLESTVRVSWKNDSPIPAGQGGIYRLYTQTLLPKGSSISQITKNNVLVEEVDSLSGQYNIIGLYLEIAPQHASEIAITYTIPVRLGQLSNYQLITQKQLGSYASNISLDLLFPEGYGLGETNIDAVVNNERISYNSILNTDKLFFIEIKKKN